MDSIGFISFFYFLFLFCHSILYGLSITHGYRQYQAMSGYLYPIVFFFIIHSFSVQQTNVCCAANDCLLRRKQMIRQYKTNEKDLYRR